MLGIGKESVGETQCFGDGKRDSKVVDDVDVYIDTIYIYMS